jgi:hypothetical protein
MNHYPVKKIPLQGVENDIQSSGKLQWNLNKYPKMTSFIPKIG